MSTRFVWSLSALLGVLVACHGDGGSGITGGGSQFSIALSVTPTELSIPVGTQQTLGVSVVRRGGYAGAVTLSVSGLPSYVTGSFEPATLSGAASQSTLTLVTNDEASVGAYPIVIHATGDSVSEQHVTVTCTLMREAGFTLSPAAPALSVTPSGTAQVAVSVARTGGFTGAVTLSVDGAPAGVTAAFVPNPATAEQSTLTVTTTSTAAIGTYSLMIHGTGTGVADRTAALTLNVVATMGYSISLSPVSVTLVPPASGTVAINIHRVGGFAGPVSLFLEGFPNGTTPTMSPTSTAGDNATLTIATSLAAVEGTYNLFVRGEAAGQPVQRVALQLIVQAAPGYLLKISNPQLTLSAGGSPQTLNIGIERTGNFTGAVTLAMSGLPAAFTNSFTPNTTTGAVSLLQVSVAAGVAPGTYTATITGRADGLADRTTTISITVVASGTPIAWRFCAASPQPVFFAYADGAGPYNAVSPANDGSYPITLASGRGTVVWVEPSLPVLETDAARTRGMRRPAITARIARTRKSHSSGVRPLQTTTTGGFTTYVQYGTTSELQALGQPACLSSTITKSVSGSVAGLLTGQGFGVGLGKSFFFGLSGTTDYTLSDLEDGAHDLISGRVNVSSGNGGLIMAVPDRMILRRNQNPANGSALPLLDFASAEAFAPATSSLSLAGTNGALVELSGAFSTANGTYAFVNGGEQSTSTSWTYFGIPSSRLIAGDLHWIIAGDAQGRTAVLFAHDITPRSLVMGPVGSSPLVSVFSTSPVVRMSAQLALGQPETEYGGSFEATFLQSSLQRAVVIMYARGAIGNSTSVEIRTPVLTGLLGWDENRYGFKTGGQVAWMIEEWNIADTYVPVDGGTIRYMTFQGQLVP